VLSDPNVAPRLAETKAAGEVKALDEFFEMMRNDSDRAFYGYNVPTHQFLAHRALCSAIRV
jgi:protein pelota